MIWTSFQKPMKGIEAKIQLMLLEIERGKNNRLAREAEREARQAELEKERLRIDEEREARD